MVFKNMLNKIAPQDEQEEILETGTKDKVLNGLRNEETRFNETEEKEILKQRLMERKKLLLRKNMFGVEDETIDEVDINNPSVNINKSSVDILRQKNLMKQSSLLTDQNRMMTKGTNTILNQPNKFNNSRNKIKAKDIKFL